MVNRKPPSIFGLRLREARLRLGTPQDRLGTMIGIDEGTASARISRYETGVHAAPYEIAVKLAKVLHVPTAYLFCEDDDLAELLLAWEAAEKADKRRLKEAIGPLLRDKKTDVATE